MSVSRLYRIRVAGVTAEPEQGALFHLQQHSVTLGAGIVRRLAQLVLWPARDAHAVGFDEQVAVGRADVDCTGSNALTILRGNSSELPGTAEYVGQHRGCFRRGVQHDEE